MNFDYYRGHDLVFPTKPTKPMAPRDGSPDDYREYADALEAYKVDMDEYNKGMVEHRKKVAARMKELHQVLKKEYNVCDGVFDELWQYAQADKSSYGLREVVDKFGELCDLVEKCSRMMISA